MQPVMKHVEARGLQTSIGELTVESVGMGGDPGAGCLKVLAQPDSQFTREEHEYLLLSFVLPVHTCLFGDGLKVTGYSPPLITLMVKTETGWDDVYSGKGEPHNRVLRDVKDELQTALLGMAEADPLWVQEGVVTHCENSLAWAKYLQYEGTQMWIAREVAKAKEQEAAPPTEQAEASPQA